MRIKRNSKNSLKIPSSKLRIRKSLSSRNKMRRRNWSRGWMRWINKSNRMSLKSKNVTMKSLNVKSISIFLIFLLFKQSWNRTIQNLISSMNKTILSEIKNLVQELVKDLVRAIPTLAMKPVVIPHQNNKEKF